ncbi:tRNA 2-selenouridine(34) synthase MnmH [Aestuariirhabdus litorea]|uniref:tRNA 2-selenouridine synthase n=1 Tax=Aestuariirhabdus litorea TaxID=2528527 RepID=A0A3P3VRI3_9GAMM|nr:tRNA 2-selenouridine(34) synthase MnmH [Aestuariirhabdus litorea]RRJ84296.1 tRNA 2-selenouridine(34) synthase MnmH [Aestuariirhabdus litorea]RWW97519.1 tRNA 2-selenouridine(34) synthase MnmH [Endozoicomonadaceae bacterium GTF-13]
MSKRPNIDIDHYLNLFLEDIPLMDVRAPVEFDKGAFPTSQNLPLLDDRQRELIGTRYKNAGQDAAIALGNEMATADIKAARVARWQAFAAAHPEGVLYCFRGGLRSKISQQWLAEAGIEMPFVEGGYKALRRFLIDSIDEVIASARFMVVGGLTGTGKTPLLAELDNSVDLEGLANHKGSSFGKQIGGQPTQINFENALAVRLLKLRAAGHSLMVLEDESRMVGRCGLPPALQEAMAQAPVVVIEAGLEERIERLQREYVEDMLTAYRSHLGEEEGYLAFSNYLLDAIEGIRRRLGGERYQQIRDALQQALQHRQLESVAGVYRDAIAQVLEQYYDPMYQYQLDQKKERIRFRGSYSEVVSYLRNLGVEQ